MNKQSHTILTRLVFNFCHTQLRLLRQCDKYSCLFQSSLYIFQCSAHVYTEPLSIILLEYNTRIKYSQIRGKRQYGSDESLCLFHFWQLTTAKIQRLDNLKSKGKECNQFIVVVVHSAIKQQTHNSSSLAIGNNACLASGKANANTHS